MLGHRRLEQGHPLNVRRREKVRRYFTEAGEELAWDEVVALSEDPVPALVTDVRKLLRSGIRLLQRNVREELAEKRAETSRLERLVSRLRTAAEDPDAFPLEIEYTHTARKVGTDFPTKTKTLEIDGPGEALKAANKLEKSLPRWEKYRDGAVDELKRKQATLNRMGQNLSEVVEGWRGLLKEVTLVVS